MERLEKKANRVRFFRRGVFATIGCLTILAGNAHAAPFVYISGGDSAVNYQYSAATDGSLQSLLPPTFNSPSGTRPYGIAVTPDGTSAYIANGATNTTVSQYTVALDGTLHEKTPPTIGAGTGPRGVAISPDGTSLYVTNGDSDNISQYDIGPSGALSAKNPAMVSGEDYPLGIAVSPDGSSVYVANTNADVISQYNVGANGVLDPDFATIGAGNEPFFGLVITPDGQNLYVANRSSNNVSQYTIGNLGLLSKKNPETRTAGSRPIGAAVRPDGLSLYVTNEGNNLVSEYDIGSTGGLTAKSSASIGAGDGPYGVVVSIDGKSVYVGNRFDDTVSQYDVLAGGVLAPKGVPTVDASHPVGGVTTTLGPYHPPSYPSPNTASPISDPLVPVYRQCGTPGNPANRQHAAPLAVGSCNPAVSGTAHVGPQMTGVATLTVTYGNFSTPQNEADISYSMTVTDVRATSASGPDYDPYVGGPDLTIVDRVRLTDRANGSSGTDPGTTSDFEMKFPANCVATADTSIGSSCSANTSQNALMPGAIIEGRSTNVQVFRVRVTDSGPNGVRDDFDDRLFLQGGIFSP